MIIGLLLGVSVAVAITSFLVIVTTSTGLIAENLATGAVIGTTGVISYAVIALILSLIAGFFLALVLRKPQKNFESY